MRDLHKYKITPLKFIHNSSTQVYTQPEPCIQSDTPCTPSLNPRRLPYPRAIHTTHFFFYTRRPELLTNSFCFSSLSLCASAPSLLAFCRYQYI
ncbi:hypothetical protein RchiOBHm_Chr2g0143421 [Rosa chinensis]|uniref:Uncharacterized protein n=1 Tax=Rosa chinensis TaxID=74649 RepID=A0A2P6RY49_ROSCH|nr:hypothetical protein RchiOBHm_Chr2g0143421 [Rosa chinensis]